MLIGVLYSLVLAGFGLSVLLTKLRGLDIQAMESAGAPRLGAGWGLRFVLRCCKSMGKVHFEGMKQGLFSVASQVLGLFQAAWAALTSHGLSAFMATDLMEPGSGNRGI